MIPFKATCEGQKTKPQHPQRYIAMDEDSQSSGEGSVLSRPATPPCASSLSSSLSSSVAPPSAALVAVPPASLPPAAHAAAPLPAATALLVPRRLSAGSDVIETAAASAGIVTLALSIPASPGGAHAAHAAHGALVVASPAQVLQQQLQPQPVVSRPPSAAPAPASLQVSPIAWLPALSLVVTGKSWKLIG